MKICKWIRGLIFMEAGKAGYREQRGHHMRGDPFQEERLRRTSGSAAKFLRSKVDETRK